IASRYQKLDVLVNNGAISIDGGHPPSELPLERLRTTYETNVFGVVAVIQAMLPLLRRSEAGRIVNMSSAMGTFGVWSHPYMGFGAAPPLAYGTSKAALNAITVFFARELRETPIKVNAAEPGPVATEMNPAGTRTPAQGLRSPSILPPSHPTGRRAASSPKRVSSLGRSRPGLGMPAPGGPSPARTAPLPPKHGDPGHPAGRRPGD